MALYSDTRTNIRHKTASLLRDLLVGTVSSPGSGTFVCALAGWERGDDEFNKWAEVYDYSGTGAGTSGKPTDWVNSTHTLTFKPAATLTANDSVEMHERFTVIEYNDAINEAINWLTRQVLTAKVDYSLVLDDLLTDGCMEGAASAWSAIGTQALVTTYKCERSQSLSLTNTSGSAADAYQTLGYHYPKYAGQPLTFHSHAYCATPDRVRIAVHDGVTMTYSDYLDTDEWTELKIDSVTLSDETTSIIVYLLIESGAAITAYFDKAWCSVGHIYEYTMPSGFVYLSKVEMEAAPGEYVANGGIDRYDTQIDKSYWKIDRGSTIKLVFDANLWTPTPGRKLRLTGWGAQSTLSSDSSTCSINPMLVAHKSAAILCRSRIRSSSSDSEDFSDQFKYHEAEVDRMLRIEQPYILPNTRMAQS